MNRATLSECENDEGTCQCENRRPGEGEQKAGEDDHSCDADENRPSLPVERSLMNAPKQQDGFFLVPRIIQESS